MALWLLASWLSIIKVSKFGSSSSFSCYYLGQVSWTDRLFVVTVTKGKEHFLSSFLSAPVLYMDRHDKSAEFERFTSEVKTYQYSSWLRIIYSSLDFSFASHKANLSLWRFFKCRVVFRWYNTYTKSMSLCNHTLPYPSKTHHKRYASDTVANIWLL